VPAYSLLLRNLHRLRDNTGIKPTKALPATNRNKMISRGPVLTVCSLSIVSSIHRWPGWFFLIAACLAACAGPSGGQAPAEVTATPVPATSVQVGDLPALDPGEIVLQQDFEPTFSSPESFYEFGRVPPVTVYADGTVIYLDPGTSYDQQQVRQVQLTPAETQSMWQQVWAAGFERLQSYTDHCRDNGDGTSVCVEDASFNIFRVRQPDGQLREVKIYHEFTDEPQVLSSVRAALSNFDRSTGMPYVPGRGALFIRRMEDPIGVTILPWPLGPEWAPALSNALASPGLAAFSLEGEALSRWLAAVPRNLGEYFFQEQGVYFGAQLIPWLPGRDYSSELEAAFPAP
jgi:hypothetical protein